MYLRNRVLNETFCSEGTGCMWLLPKSHIQLKTGQAAKLGTAGF